MTSDDDDGLPTDLKERTKELYRRAKVHRDRNACTFTQHVGRQSRPSSLSTVMPIDHPTPSASEKPELQWISLWNRMVLGQLGPGVQLYFELHLMLGICFFVMFLISTPTLYWCLKGTQVEDLDPYGVVSSFYKSLAKASIGNLGSCPQCTLAELHERPLYATGSTRVKDVTLSIAWLDFAGMVVYLIFVAWFQFWWLPRSTNDVDQENDTASDFAIQIQRLPRVLGKDSRSNVHLAYQDKLKDHFVEVIKKFLPESAPEEAVCEVALVREYDGALTKFMEIAGLERQKKNAEAGVRWARRASKEDLAEGLEKTKSKLEDQIKALKDATGERIKEVNREVCMAFVMFRTEALKSQVLRLYENSEKYLVRAVQNEDLRFEGRRLHIKEAEDPSDLIWENLDYARSRHLCRTTLTIVLAIILVVLVCLWIAWLRSYNPFMDTSVTPGNLWVISTAAFGATGANCTQACAWHTAIDSLGQLPTGSVYRILSGGQGEIWRNTSKLPMPLRSTSCSSVVSSGCGADAQDWIGIQFVNPETVRSMRIVSPPGYAGSKLIPMGCSGDSVGIVNSSGVFTSSGQVWDPSAHCVVYTGVDPRGSFEGLVGIKKDVHCDSVSPLPAVQAVLAAGANPVADAMVSCFCAMQAKAQGLSFGLHPLVTDAQKACQPWIESSRKMTGISLAAILSTLILNNILNIIFGYLDAWAKYPTETSFAESQFINLFIAQFVNSAIITVVTSASTYWISLFHGSYDDVNLLWWMNVGASMFFTFLMVVLSAGLIAPVVWNMVVQPLINWFTTRGLYEQTAWNEAVMLPEFCLSMRLGESVVVVWCVLMYSGGMPLLYLIAAGYCFLAYWMDKWVLLRRSRRPPQYMAGALDNALHMLPVAVFPHALMSMSFYGNQEVFPSEWLDTTRKTVLYWSRLGDMETYHQVTYIFSSQGSDVKGPSYALFLKARMLDLARQAAWPMLFLFFLAVCWCLAAFAARYLLRPAFPGTFDYLEDAFKKRVIGDGSTDTAKTYQEVKEKIKRTKAKIVFSYLMQENKFYKAAHDALNNQAAWTAESQHGDEQSVPLGEAPHGVLQAALKVMQDEKCAEECEEKMLDCLEAVLTAVTPTCCRSAEQRPYQQGPG